jgi:hypothetical protein
MTVGRRHLAWPLVAIVCVILVAMATAGGSLISAHPIRWRPRLLSPPTSSSQQPAPTTHVRTGHHPTSSGWHVPHWAVLVALAVGLTVAMVALTLISAWLMRRPMRRVLTPTIGWVRSHQVSDVVASASMGAHLDAAAVTLADESDPRGAVIGCWLRLEEAAAGAGVKRQPSETSADLVHRVLSAYDVDQDCLRGLHTLYNIARFAPRAVGEDDRRAAAELLTSVREHLNAFGAADGEHDDAFLA